jgi:hypothetical protein
MAYQMKAYQHAFLILLWKLHTWFVMCLVNMELVIDTKLTTNEYLSRCRRERHYQNYKWKISKIDPCLYCWKWMHNYFTKHVCVNKFKDENWLFE